MCGWPSASLLHLQSDESPLDSGPLSLDEASWVGSLLCVGAVCGNIAFGLITERLGQKLPMMIDAGVMVVSECERERVIIARDRSSNGCVYTFGFV